MLSVAFPLRSIDAPLTIRVERTVTRLRALVERNGLARALAIGGAVIEELYGGDLHRWRLRNRKGASLRALARDPALPVSAATLYRALACYELAVSASGVAGVSAWKHVTLQHFRVVLAAPVNQQVALLREAEADRWAVAVLQRAVRAGSRRPTRGGRPRLDPRLRALRLALRAMDELEATMRTHGALPGELLDPLRGRLVILDNDGAPRG